VEKQARLQRFLQDETTAHLVKEVLVGSFLKPKQGEDTEMKAARFVAIGLLEDGWRELNKYKNKELDVSPASKQVGL
jgi:hypothetical protein